MRRPLFALALLTTACHPFERPADFHSDSEDALWDAEVVATADGIYARLPASQRLVRVQADGTVSTVDIDGTTPERLVATPDGSSLLAFTTWQECEDPDADAQLVSDCAEDDLVQKRELMRIEGDKRIEGFDVPAHLNALAFSEDGRMAVAYLDYSSGMTIEVDGLIDLGEVMFIPLDGAGSPRSVSVGFSPEKVLFSQNSEGINDKAVIFSRSEVLVVDLSTLETLVSYPLVLDADQVVDPADAVLTEDGRIALVAIQGSSDLYELDLEKHSIDLEELEASPTSMANAILPGADDGNDLPVSLIAYSSMARVDILDQDLLELREPLLLDEPVTDILVTPESAVLYNSSSAGTKDVYHVHLATTEITEFRVANPIEELQLTPGLDYAVATLAPEYGYSNSLDAYQDNNWGLAVIDLIGEQETSLILEAEPVGLAITESEGTTWALVLMDGVENVVKVDLSRPTFFSEVELEAAPIGIGKLASGEFYITHDSALGLISILDPATDKITEASGFATAGLLMEPMVIDR
jgi:hypothetical protein